MGITQREYILHWNETFADMEDYHDIMGLLPPHKVIKEDPDVVVEITKKIIAVNSQSVRKKAKEFINNSAFDIDIFSITGEKGDIVFTEETF